MALKAFILAATIATTARADPQTVLGSSGQFTTFQHPIRRVAVVGAGPSGLQAVVHLIAHNFTARLFERAPDPGGNWLYSEEPPLREPYPDKPVGQTVGLPDELPAARYYTDGDDGMTLDDRWKEHWSPRPVWHSLHTNSPKVSTELPDVRYDPDTPWVLSAHEIQRHVRSYASHHCLNSNDHPVSASGQPVTAYSTRVEKVEKDHTTNTWVLTLKRLERLRESERIRAEWWTESFDAVVLATGPYAAPHVPDITGIVDWSKAKEGEQYNMYHSQSYRRPERYANKTVLIVGASVSASEIARDIGPFAHRIIASVRPPKDRSGMRQRSLARFPITTEFVPEIASFAPLGRHDIGLRNGKISLINGSIIQGIDEIILATGYLRTALFPANATQTRPENLHWTGHYIPDPTLAFTNVRPWTLGRYQSYGLAKVWQGTARLPNEKAMRDEERTAGPYWLQVWLGEVAFRRYITWLNDASMVHGGRFVQPPPVEHLELLKYYSVVHFLNNTMNIDTLNLFSIDPAEETDPWNAWVSEDDDW
ncbi:FAD/NAD-P-binding domain-containing protein [Mycena rebaudengoi]|nr:FAD/NAD-P-binding domain-containing protein [Mycena rebaudengoi]